MKKSISVSLLYLIPLSFGSVVPAVGVPVAECTNGNLTIFEDVLIESNLCEGQAVIPATVVQIEPYAFSFPSPVTSVSFEQGSLLSEIATSAFEDSAITSISIPPSVEVVGDFAFTLSASLETVMFESGSLLSIIGERSFEGTALSSISLPSGVEEIGAGAFSNNPSLTSITFKGMKAPTTVGLNAFAGIGPEPKLYLEPGATGFGRVGQFWNGLLIASGGDAIPQAQNQGISVAPVIPQVISKSFSLAGSGLTAKNRKAIRALVRASGKQATFEVIVGVARDSGPTKRQARALALRSASEIKRYLVSLGVNPKAVLLQAKSLKSGVRTSVRVLATSKPPG